MADVRTTWGDDGLLDGEMYIRKKNITSIPANPWWKWMEMFFNGSKWRGVTSVPLIL